MRILIRNRYKVFTHRPGALVPLPFSHYALHIFPTKLAVLDLLNENKVMAVIDFCQNDFLENFTVELDLEKGLIVCHGSHFKVVCVYDGGKVIIFQKLPTIKIVTDDHGLIVLKDTVPKKEISAERIAFGVFKKPSYDRIEERADMSEILPIWHALSKQMPHYQATESSSLLSELKGAIGSFETEKIIPLFTALFRTGFQALLCPQMSDHKSLGYKLPPLQAATPLALISEGAALIRSLLFTFKDDHLAILPLLPKELASGRMTGCLLDEKISFDSMWRSKKLLKASFTSLEDATLTLSLPKGIRQYRYRDMKNKLLIKLKPEDPLVLKAGTFVMLDQFIY